MTSEELTEHELWLIGDFNINFLKRSDSSTKKAIDFARIYGLKQLINSVTHLTGFGGSCIDLVFTNAEFVKSLGVLNDVISEVQATSLIYGRTYVNYDASNLQILLTNSNWDNYFRENDPNALWDMLLECILSILNVMCPFKHVKVSIKRPYWLSHHIIESINDRNKLFRLAKASGDPTVFASARIARNRTNKLINSSKEDFIKDSLEANKSDPKKFWRIINNYIIKKQTCNMNISLKTPDGVQLSELNSCEFMNNFLSGFGQKLQDEFDRNMGPNIVNHTSYNIVSNDRNYNVTPRDVQQALNEIATSKGSGLDCLPTFILKDAFSCLLPQVAHLMNQSLITGVFPDKWAIATVTPIPKAGDLTNAGNWRPISILPLPGIDPK